MTDDYLDQFLASLRRHGLHADTIAEYRIYLGAYLDYLARHHVSSPFAAGPDLPQAYCTALAARGERPKTVWKKQHGVYRFYEWARQEGFILVNPCPVPVLAGGDSLPRDIPSWELLRHAYGRLESVQTVHYWVVRDLAMLDLAYACGLRRCELQRLDLEDIDPAGGTVRVRGKGDRERLVPLGRRSLDTLLRYLYEVRPRLHSTCPTRALFISWKGGGKRLCRESINAVFRRLHRRYGVHRTITPHNLRHAFATDLLRNGAPVQDVSRMLGHARLETTTAYTRVVARDLKRCHARCHPRG